MAKKMPAKGKKPAPMKQCAHRVVKNGVCAECGAKMAGGRKGGY